MNTYAHITLGSMIAYSLRSDGCDICSILFRYGCAAPDFWPSHIVQPHDCSFCSRGIKEETELLTLAFTAPYSVNAGLVCHYICDYFCRAHNDAAYSSFIVHDSYERSLNAYVKQNKWRLHALTSQYYDTLPACSSSGEILSNIRQLKEQYLAAAPSFETDVTYALRACLTVLVNAAECAKHSPYARLVDGTYGQIA